MPHKKNPIRSERIAGLARVVRAYVTPVTEGIPLWHERDISHSSTERIALPDAAIATDYLLHLTTGLVDGLVVDADRMRANLEPTGGLIYTSARAARRWSRRGCPARTRTRWSRRRRWRPGRPAPRSGRRSARRPPPGREARRGRAGRGVPPGAVRRAPRAGLRPPRGPCGDGAPGRRGPPGSSTCTRGRCARSTSCPAGRCCSSPPTASPPTTTCCRRHPGQGADAHPAVGVVVRAARRPGAPPPGRDDPRSRPGVAGRAMLVPRLSMMLPVECVARGYLAGSGWHDYQRTGADLRRRAAARAGRGLPAAGADLHPDDEGAGRGARRDDPGLGGGRPVGRDARGRAAGRSRSRSTGGRRASRPSGGIIARRHQVRVRPTTRRGGCCWATRCSRPTRPGSGRPTAWRPGRPQPSYDKQFVRDWLDSPESGWDRPAAAEPPPELPDWVVARTRDLYVEAYERITGDRWP